MVFKSEIMINVILLVATGTAIASAWGMGKNDSDHMSAPYQAASAFLYIGLTVIIIAMLAGMFIDFRSINVPTKIAS